MASIKLCVLAVVFLFYQTCHGMPNLQDNPLHASCTVDWTFSAGCDAVHGRIVDIIKKWTGDGNCKQSGERCLYKLTSESSTEIKAVHETPKKHYKDDLTFTLGTGAGNSGCNVKGHSTSETWYAVLDYGTNYCNLHNLITGADLDKDPSYKETTSNSRCTQYSTANCDKY